jgi:hypothetical protein
MITNAIAKSPLVAAGAIELFDRDMTVTVAANVPLAALQSSLTKANQWLPIDGDENTSVGELVERNSSGPLRLGFGGWRDLLLGCQFTNGREELITVGGRAMKNVAGYDLTKFMVGQHGVFGKIVTITTRTYRLPTAALLATSSVCDAESVNRLLASSCRPQWMLIGEGHLYCGYLGDPRTIDFYQATLPSYQPSLNELHLKRHDLETDTALRSTLWAAGQPPSKTGLPGQPNVYFFRASVPPSKLRDLLQNKESDLLQFHWVGDPCFGIAVGRIQQEDGDRFRKIVEAMGGTVWYWSSLGECMDVDRQLGSDLLLQRIRNAFA